MDSFPNRVGVNGDNGVAMSGGYEYTLVLGLAGLSVAFTGTGTLSLDALRKLDLDRIPRRRLECTSQHPLGTARMGISPEHAVVGPDGEVFELDELYVADGSIIPTSLGVNPQETIMAMATRVAFKLRDRPLPPLRH